MCVNYFASVLLGLVPEAANDFFKQNRANDPYCDALNIAMEMLSEWDKDWVVQSLYFNAVSLDFWNSAITQLPLEHS